MCSVFVSYLWLQWGVFQSQPLLRELGQESGVEGPGAHLLTWAHQNRHCRTTINKENWKLPPKMSYIRRYKTNQFSDSNWENWETPIHPSPSFLLVVTPCRTRARFWFSRSLYILWKTFSLLPSFCNYE